MAQVNSMLRMGRHLSTARPSAFTGTGTRLSLPSAEDLCSSRFFGIPYNPKAVPTRCFLPTSSDTLFSPSSVVKNGESSTFWSGSVGQLTGDASVLAL